MDHPAEKTDVRTLVDEAWLREACHPFNVVAALTSALTPHWTVDRECDPSGNLTVIMLPASDTSARPTFVLYEDNGLVQVSTFLGEDWQKRHAFLTCQRAVSAIVATAGRDLLRPPPAHAPDRRSSRIGSATAPTLSQAFR
jgi:hypothetical protein